MSDISETTQESSACVGTQTCFPKSIALGLLHAQSNLKGVRKASENKFHGYKYAGAEDVITSSRNALHEQGLILIRDSAQLDVREGGKSAVLLSTYILASKDGDAMVHDQSFPVCPGNGRPMDKAVASAMTTSMSYFLRDLLMIPRVDGEEVDLRDDTSYKHGLSHLDPDTERKTKEFIAATWEEPEAEDNSVKKKATRKKTTRKSNTTEVQDKILIKKLSNEIRDNASSDQLDKMNGNLGSRGFENLEELSLSELQQWHKKVMS